MFGACMTEKSYVECTASCLAALALYRKHYATLGVARLDCAALAAELKDGKPHGQGTVTFVDGRVQKGIWENGKLKPWWKF